MKGQARREFQARADRVDAALGRLEALPPGGPREDCVDAVQAVLDLHQQALAHLLSLVGPGPAAELAQDEVVSGLLLLHGLHPRTLRERVEQALAEVRPYLDSHGGGVRVVSLDGDGLRLRLEGSCQGCPSSLATLRGTIEQALAERAPDLPSLKVDGAAAAAPPAPPGFVGVGSIGRRPHEAEWRTTTTPNAPLEVRSVAGVQILLCRSEGVDLAYRDRCPDCSSSLGGARLEGRVLTCGGCGRGYDVRAAGRSPEDPARHLEPVPLLAAENGRLRIQVPASGAPVPVGP